VLKTDFHPQEGAIISVRGKGRFLFDGIRSETKKGRLRALIKLYK
jgi:RNA-binding protein YlmH